jgi:hypothetical protein
METLRYKTFYKTTILFDFFNERMKYVLIGWLYA